LPNPPHLGLSQLKSFVARMSIAIELEARPLPQANQAAKSVQIGIRDSMIAAADRLKDQPSGRLDEAVAKLAEDFRPGDVVGQGVPFDDLRNRMSRLADGLAGVNCAKCAGSKDRICRGEPAHDQIIISTRGHCIRKLRDLLKFVTSQTGRIYAEATDRAPAVCLSTRATHENADQELLRAFNVGACCEVFSDAECSSFVALVIKDRSFDWDTLCGLPYLLTHEVVCHAFQDLHAEKRRGADEKCGWSEGWMDRLAHALTHRWLEEEGKSGFPAWLDKLNVRAQTEKIHGWRYEPRGTLTEDQADVLDSNRRAFDELREFWGKAPVHRHKIAKFSARLNACDTSNQVRQDIVQSLHGIIRHIKAPIKAELALGHCVEFIADGDALGLLNHLKELENTPIDVLLMTAGVAIRSGSQAKAKN
jgi:hypothetical protein